MGPASASENNNSNGSSSAVLRTALLSVLRDEGLPYTPQQQLPDTDEDRRRLLGDVVISSNMSNWKEETLQLLDEIYYNKEDDAYVISWSNLSVDNGLIAEQTVQDDKKTAEGTRVMVWRGDLTTLSVDAVVNAANDSGLGCFRPEHRCIDNVLHRRAGPRLRLACRRAMTRRSSRLEAGTPPIVTEGYALPAKHVVHVTGPQIAAGVQVTEVDRSNLASAYWYSLEAAAARNLKSIAFPCISTGLFGFPSDEASEIALWTVRSWLESNPGRLDAIVFDVFTDKDEAAYRKNFEMAFSSSTDDVGSISSGGNISSITGGIADRIAVAKNWIDSADAVLIVAGAGMSVKDGEMVYTNADDFARHYPWFVNKWGYRTAYETMGLSQDENVPETAKWGLWAKHMDNMRWQFEPSRGYELLWNLVRSKDVFVLTSNVDGCFERSGFPVDRIYTPQGEWTYTQCLGPCRPDSVFETRPILDDILPHLTQDGEIPQHLLPRCRNCGGKMFGNVRGGQWFLHTKYEEQNKKLQGWMHALAASNSNKKVVVLEIGAGFNTPTVTRFPAESFARELGDRGSLIRINPSESRIPSGLRALSLEQGWEVLGDILAHKADLIQENGELEVAVATHQEKEGSVTSAVEDAGFRNYFGHFDWRCFLGQLRI